MLQDEQKGAAVHLFCPKDSVAILPGGPIEKRLIDQLYILQKKCKWCECCSHFYVPKHVIEQRLATLAIDHFTVFYSVTRPLNGSKAGGDLAPGDLVT